MLVRISLLLALVPLSVVSWPRERSLPAPESRQAVPACAEDDAGLDLPDGFCAFVVEEDLGIARHVAVAENGDIYVARRRDRDGEGGGVVALRDLDGDGRSDVRLDFGGENGGTGITIHDGHVYFAHDAGVVRARLVEGQLEPRRPLEIIVSELPGPGTAHSAKSAVIDEDGNLFVNIGAPSNSCQEEDRQVDSPGQDPCPELETRGGIWRFSASRTGQVQSDGTRFATGLRNTFALAIQPGTGLLWGAQHGRDQLFLNWQSAGYTEEDQAEKPAEEFVQINEGDNFGWPYCYFDPELNAKVLAPEFGGDGGNTGRCGRMKNPTVALPAHWAPNAVAFYAGEQFPERYHGGVFIAFHGSWNRAPLPQGGYNVIFIPFEDGQPTGEWEVFADGFAGEQVDPRSADHRPAGLAVGPDGSLYVSDDRGGVLYRIVFTG